MNKWDSGGGGFGYLFPGINWWKDSNWVDSQFEGHGGGSSGQGMSGSGTKHDKFPDYMDPADDPCEKAKTLAQKMLEILNSKDVKSAIEEIKTLMNQQTINGQIKENAFAIGFDSNGKFHISVISTASNTNPHSVSYNHFDPNSGINQIGVFHNHTSDNSNSPGDFYELLSSNVNHPNYITNFAQNNLGEIFALNIYDRPKAMAFLQKYPKDQNIDGPNFKGELLADYFNFRSTADWTVNGNTNAGQVALVAFLEKFDTGILFQNKQVSPHSIPTNHQHLQKHLVEHNKQPIQHLTVTK